MPTVVYPSGVSMQASADCPTQASRPARSAAAATQPSVASGAKRNVLRRRRLRRRSRDRQPRPSAH